MITLNEKDYYKKVYGGWMGKNIGGTLGGPVEGVKELMSWTFYPKLYDGPAPNDDLDLQLVWLHALEQYGTSLKAKELSQEWLDHIFFPMDEYGYSLENLRRGLVPPVSGCFNNPFIDCMGSPIRSEIWAMVAPGAPGVAAYYAYQDSIVDHAGGEGVYGEMFFAAVESAAFFENDPNKLLDIGLTFIPEECRTAKAVRDIRKWHGEGKDWITARNLIIEHHGRDNVTDAPQNIAITILGLLYGKDFEDSMLKAVNCGYDADCTAATLGSILGIIGGKDTIPEKWSAPIGDKILLSTQVNGFSAPKELDELTRRTIKIGKKLIAAWNIPMVFSATGKTDVPESSKNEKGQVIGDYDPRWLWNYSFNTNRYLLPEGSIESTGLEVIIDYEDTHPSIGKNMEKGISFKIYNSSEVIWEGILELIAPDGFDGYGTIAFKLEPGETTIWNTTVKSNSVLKPYYNFQFNIHRYYKGNPWNTSTINFTLVSSTHWTICGPDGKEKNIICPGNNILFEKAFDFLPKGVYRAKTTLINPKDRRILIACATASPVKVYLDGRPVLEDPNWTEFRPSYHFTPGNKQAETDLAKGEHVLEIEVVKDELPLEVYVIPSATWTDKMEDTYYLTDILMS